MLIWTQTLCRQPDQVNVIFFALMEEKALSTEDVGGKEQASEEKEWPSYSMVEARMRKIYFRFYKETYKASDIDRKTKELIAIAASLGFNCAGCLEGHLKKALDYGATKEEISESISIAMGVAAAGVVDQTDIAAEKLQIDHFD
ncbi:MAG: carboxymuconolactone decarboxylase family protein [Acidobacteriota bacterium]